MANLLGFGYKAPSPVDKPYFNEASNSDLLKAKIHARGKNPELTGYDAMGKPRTSAWGRALASGLVSVGEGIKNLTPRDILNAPYNAVTAIPSVLGGLASSVGKSMETMVKPSGSLYKYPGMTGLSPVSPAQQKATTDTTLNLMGLSAVPGTAARIAGKEVARSDSTLGMFLGESAVTADKAALTKAKKMTEAGKSRDSVLKQTGWFKDSADKRWKFEISDIDARLAAVPANVYREQNLLNKLLSGNRMFSSRKNYLDQVLDHPELYKAYPSLRDIEFDLVKDLTKYDGSLGTYTPGGFGRTASIQLDAKLTEDAVARMLRLERKLKKDTASYKEQMEYGAFRETYPDYLSLDEWVKRERKENGDEFATAEQMAKAEEVGYDQYFGADYQRDLFDNFSPNIADNAVYAKSTMLHEVQHAIQDLENFAMGGGTGSKRYVEDSTKKGMERKEALGTLANALKDEKGNVKPRYKASKETRILDEMVTDVAEELKSLGMYVNTGEGPRAIRNFRPLRSEMIDSKTDTRSSSRQQKDTQIPLLGDKIWLQVQNGKVIKGDTPEVPIKDLHNQLMENGATLNQADRLMKDIKAVYGFQNDLPKYFGVGGDRHNVVKKDYGQWDSSEKHIPTALASPTERYLRIAGEAEARNVQARARFSPEKLREYGPWKSIDVTNPDLLTAVTRVPENFSYTRPTLTSPTETSKFRYFKGDR